MQGDIRRARDPELLDALDAYERTTFSGHVWRVAREGRNPLEPSRAGGRWDIGGTDGYDVLYTAMEADGAIAEVAYHRSLQPIAPSRTNALLYKIQAQASSVLRIEAIDQLVQLGVNRERYREPLYERTQEIGDAAAFLGCDALIVPSARWDGLNIVLFFNALASDNIKTLGEAISIDWSTRRTKPPRRQKA